MKDVLKLISAKGKEVVELEKEKETLQEEIANIVKEQDIEIRRHISIDVLEEYLAGNKARLSKMKNAPKKIVKILWLTLLSMGIGTAVTLTLTPIGIILILFGCGSLFEAYLTVKNNTPQAIIELQDYIDKCVKEIAIIKEEQPKIIARNKKIAQLNARIIQLTSEITNEILNFTKIGKDLSLDMINLEAKNMGNLGMPSCYVTYPEDDKNPIMTQVLVKTFDKK